MKVIITNDKVASVLTRHKISLLSAPRSMLFKIFTDTRVHKYDDTVFSEELIEKFLKRERVSKIPKELFLNFQNILAERNSLVLTVKELTDIFIEAGRKINKYYWVKEALEILDSVIINETKLDIICITDVYTLLDYNRIKKHIDAKKMELLYIIDNTTEELKDLVDLKVVS